MDRDSLFPSYTTYHLSDSEKAKMAAAQARLDNASQTQTALNKFIDSGDDRERARARVKALEDMVLADQKRLTELSGPNGNGKIADMARANLQKDKEDLELEKVRLKRVDAGQRWGGREVTERERIGLGSPTIALLEVAKSQDRKQATMVRQLDKVVERLGIIQKQQGSAADGPLGLPHF